MTHSSPTRDEQAQFYTAVKAVFLLYKRWKWELLEELGLEEEVHGSILFLFDEMTLPIGCKRLRDNEDIRNLLKFCPPVAQAARTLLHREQQQIQGDTYEDHLPRPSNRRQDSA